MHHDTIRPADSICDITDFWQPAMDPENALGQSVTAYFDHAIVPCASINPDAPETEWIMPILDRFEIKEDGCEVVMIGRARLVEMFGRDTISRLEDLHAEDLNE